VLRKRDIFTKNDENLTPRDLALTIREEEEHPVTNPLMFSCRTSITMGWKMFSLEGKL
jgi:hypothetical protein